VALLFLAAGYEHKNHVILPSLVRELRRRGLANIIQIFVTLDASKSPYEQNMIKMKFVIVWILDYLKDIIYY